jgi:hypothetical protein
MAALPDGMACRSGRWLGRVIAVGDPGLLPQVVAVLDG